MSAREPHAAIRREPDVPTALSLLAECLTDEVAWTGEELVARMEEVYEALGGNVNQLDADRG